MAKYRHALPQRNGGIFLTDGGMETTLIFQEGIELPHFAAFVLLDSAEGRQQLKRYYAAYLSVARDHGTGFVLDSPTWRANPDWGAKLGYDAAALKAINVRSIAFLEELRAGWERPGEPCVISGAIGPRGDGYKAGTWMPTKRKPIIRRRSRPSSRAAPTSSPPIRSPASMRPSASRAQPVARDTGSHLVHRGDRWPADEGRDVARGDRARGSGDRWFGRILPDQLRPSDAFRGRLKAGEPGRSVSMASGPTPRPRATPNSTNPKRSIQAIRPILGGVT